MLKRLNGFPLIVVATAVTGIAGFVVTLIVYREATPAGYAVFAVFWAGLYLVVGGLSGIQQEVTRSTFVIEPGTRRVPSRARNFAIVASLIVFVLVIATAPLWVGPVFPTVGWPLVWPLAVAAGSYIFVATLSGSLYGVNHWRSLALVIVADGVLRLIILLIALVFTRDVVALAWVVAVPFPLAVAILWPFIRRTFVGRSDIDVGYRALTWNVLRVVLASVSTAVLVSGFPLLLGTTAHHEPKALVAELIFTITLARAPLVVSAMALQSFFVVKFRDLTHNWWRVFLSIQGLIVAGGIVLAALGWLLGPGAFELVSSKPVTLDGAFIAILVGTSVAVAAMSVCGSALLARGAHFLYSFGWAVAAIATVVVMFSPIEFVPRVVFALIIGPVSGLVVYLTWLVATRRGVPGSVL